MRTLILAALMGMGTVCFGQSQITGTNPAQPGSTEYYEVEFEMAPPPVATIYWHITGGTVISSNVNASNLPAWCEVLWDDDPQTPGIVEVYADPPGLHASLQVMPGGSLIPDIYPIEQMINYGTFPDLLTVLFSIPPAQVSYQWQAWNALTLSWEDLQNTNAVFQPVSIIGESKFRCIVIADGITYTPEAIVRIKAFEVGTIALAPPITSVDYNSIPVLISEDAVGGFCFATEYNYTWEYSVEDGPWYVVGIGSTFPLTAPPIIGKTAIRRRTSCGGVELISNVLILYPNYTPVDFENRNYTRQIDVIKKGIVSWYQADALPVGDKFQTTTYLDGSGREIQSVVKGCSDAGNNTWNDLVKHFEYDGAGRVIKNFLPYASQESPGKFKNNAASEQSAFVTSFYGENPGEPTYSLTEYDESPLRNQIKSMAPGHQWAGNNIGHSRKDEYNFENEKVHIWSLAYSNTALPVSSTQSTYASGKLLKTTITNEAGNKVIQYHDFTGKLILKKIQESLYPGITHLGWACTYFVYDDFGRQRFIVTPKAVEYLENKGWNLTQPIADELCFSYTYDHLGRMILRKQPGAGEESIVYDKKGRMVLTQHANQLRVNNPALTEDQWSFMLYDKVDRLVATGLLNNKQKRAPIQAIIDGGGLPASATISAFAGGSTVTLTVESPVAGSSGQSTYITGNKNIVFNTINHFDGYDFPGVRPFNSTFTLAYNSAMENVEPTIKTLRTKNKHTGEKIRVIDGDNNNSNDHFLYTSNYFDEKGRIIQVLSDNYFMYDGSGQDYQVYQYNASSALISYFCKQTPKNGANYTITTKQVFNKIGHLLGISKSYNGSYNYKEIVSFTYDALGRLKNKRLAPGYTGNGGSEIESLNYDYNIQGWLTGINKDYALSENNYRQWERYFGMYLGYTPDEKFTGAQYNGNINGIIWKSQGDNSPRKMQFTYDHLHRFVGAAFQQRNRPSDSWANNEVDFSTQVSYEDGNGNIKSMKQWGIIPGLNNGILIDDLRYSYLPTGAPSLDGNKLKLVQDMGSLSQANNGLLGDFKDENTSQDYFYNKNGNIVKDLNKHIRNGSSDGVTYNFLNMPQKIVINGKSVVEFTYDATGQRLAKKITYTNVSPQVTRFAVYIDNFVYEDGKLSYILHEEGRLKIITRHVRVNNNDYDLNAGSAGLLEWPGGKQGVFEYFIKDHLGSTRMVLTEEVQKEYYLATMQANLAAQEAPLFGQVDPNTFQPGSSNELNKTRFLNSPPANTVWPGNNTDVVKLTATSPDRILGPNMVLKVMAGDIISGLAKYYYLSNDPGGTGDLLSSVATSFISSLGGAQSSVLGKNQSTAITNNLLSNLNFNDFIGHNGGFGYEPKAYLNMVFFDEQFKFIEQEIYNSSEGSGYVKVSSKNDPNASLFLQKKATRNGWVYIFLSNESDEVVYFDDFSVTQDHSRIAEENHYYPFGVKMAGICSRAFNKQANRYNFQGAFSEEETETGWNEYQLRMYDPQLGRWTSVDPLDEFASPYIGMGNNPTIQVDPSGGKTSQWFDWFEDPEGNVVYLENTYIWNTPKGYKWLFQAGPVFDPRTNTQMFGDLFGNVGPAPLPGVFVTNSSFINSVGRTRPPWFTEDMIHREIPSINKRPPKPPPTNFQKNIVNIAAMMTKTPQFKVAEYIVAGPINDAYITGKSMTSGLLGHSKYNFKDLFGNSVGHSKRIEAGLNTLSAPAFMVSPEMRALNFNPSVVDLSDIYYMQNNIKNVTGNWTVLGNAEGLLTDALDPKILTIRVWRDVNGKIWTLDHRRLAAFKLAGYSGVPVKWAKPSEINLKKFSTINDGTGIRLKFDKGNWFDIP